MMPPRLFGMRVQLVLLTLLCAGNAVPADRSLRVEAEAGEDAPRLTAAEAQSDFDLLRRALEEAHGGLYRYSPKATLDRLFESHRARLSRPLGRGEFIGVVSEMLAHVRDGHMRLEYDETTAASLANARLLPLRLMMSDSQLMVLSNDTPADSTIRPGMQVLGINGRPADEIVALILPKLPGDGFIETGKRMRLARLFARYYWLFVDRAAEFTIVARDATGRTVTTTLAGVLDGDRTKTDNPVNAGVQAALAKLAGPRENVSLRFVDQPDIAYLRIRAFDGEDYPAAVATAFQRLRGEGTRALILDLRGNAGGVDEYGAFLVSQLTDKPYRYFDRIRVTTIRPSFATWKPSTFEDLRAGVTPDPAGGYLLTGTLHKGVLEKTPADCPFLGTLLVLVDGGTFSTAADVSAVLHHLNRASFVGEETGGGYEGNTSGLNALIVLPNSRLKLKIMMYDYWNAVAPRGRGRGTQPDHSVATRITDLLQGIDAPLDRAVALAREAMSVPASPAR